MMKKEKDNKVFEIESDSEVAEFENIATGRKFFKVGQRVIDICQQEIERYKYNNSGFFLHLIKKSKYNNKKEKNMIENRISSIIRAIAKECINNDEEKEELILDSVELTKQVRNYLLCAIKEYKDKNNGNKDNSKIIELKTKAKKEA